MRMRFTYELINADHIADEQRADIERALSMSAYVCQREFEKALDLYHEINVIAEATDEAFVASIEFDGDDVYVELDCARVII